MSPGRLLTPGGVRVLRSRHEVKDKVYDAKETALRVRMTKQFLSIARHCKAVVACRVSPAQKAAIVKVVRKGVKPQPLTLAIGACRRLEWFRRTAGRAFRPTVCV